MRQSLSILLASVLLLMSFTACADTQNVELTANSGMPQEMGQHGSGTMPQGERPTREKSGDGNARIEDGQNERKDGGPDASSAENSVEKTVTGTVKSIVGNEVVLIITKTTDAVGKGREDKENPAQISDSSQEEEPTENSTPQTEDSGTTQEITETYLVPVGMSIGSKDFSAIKAGNTLKIYFGTDPNDGSEIITAVELR